MSARKVGKAIYLAEFATYIQMLTAQPIPWDVFAELVNAADPEKAKDNPVDASLLQKNFRNFIDRNEELYRDGDVTAYLAACAQLPEKEQLTLVSWTAKRRASNERLLKSDQRIKDSHIFPSPIPSHSKATSAKLRPCCPMNVVQSAGTSIREMTIDKIEHFVIRLNI